MSTLNVPSIKDGELRVFDPRERRDFPDLLTLPRPVLLAGLAVAGFIEGNRRCGEPEEEDLLPAILSENVYGWTLGVAGLGGVRDFCERVHFDPKDLEIAVRLGRFFAWREQVAEEAGS